MLVYINNTLIIADAGSLVITDAVGQRTTCEFVVRDDAGATTFQQGQTVKVVDETNNNTILFSGFIDNIEQTKRSYAATISHQIQCVDYHYLCDKRIVAKTYANQTADAIVNDVIATVLNAEGVIGATVAPTFTRASVAYNAEGGSVSSGAPRYEAGAFGNAVWVEEGTTNLLSANQSSVETDTTGFGNNTGTLSRDTTTAWTGSASLKLVTTTTGDKWISVNGSTTLGSFTTCFAVTPNQSYTFSAYLKSDGTAAVTLRIIEISGTGSILHDTTLSPSSLATSFTRLIQTYTASASSAGVLLRIQQSGTPFGSIWADGIQWEQKSYATSWQIGGTARVGETLALPPASTVANPQEGTVDIRFYATSNALRQVSNTFTRLFTLGTPAATYQGIILYHASNAANWILETRLADNTSPTSVTVADSNTAVGSWHLVTCTWSATSNIIEVYVDGALKGSLSSPSLPTALHTTAGAYIGYDGSANFLDSTVDGFRLSTRRRTAAEIAAYASSALSYDADTSYLLNFDSNLTPQTSIQSAATVTTAIFDYITASDCMDQLADFAGFWWNIDAHNLLHFSPRTQINAPFTADGTLMDDASVKVQVNNPMYRNRQYIKGGTDVTSSQTETRQGDGKATTFTMSYPLAQVPTITLNGGAQTVGIKGVDSGKNWYWSKGDPVISQDSSGTKLLSTDTLSVTYVGEFPIVVLAYDSAGVTSRQSIEGGTTTGYVEAAESVNNVTSSAQGFQIANARISRYSNLAGVTITFDTLTYGLAPGQTLVVNLPSHNVNNVQTLIESVTTHDDPSLMTPIYSVKALVGPANTTYVQFWNALFAKTQGTSNQSSIGSANTTLAIETPFSETWTWSANESVTESVFSCPVPSATLFPSATLYPC